MIKWAEKIVFMEGINYKDVQITFKGADSISGLAHKSLIWNIEDDYNYMDSALQYILRYKIEGIL